MTEAEWVACDFPADVVGQLDPARFSRRLILFYLSACHRLSGLFTEEATKNALQALERFAERPPPLIEWDELLAVAEAGSRNATPVGIREQVPLHERARESAADAVHSIVVACHPGTEPGRASAYHLAALNDLAESVTLSKFAPHLRTQDIPWPPAHDAHESAQQVRDLHEIVGNPFRPPSFDVTWRTDTVVTLARQMYESREFSAMPILADALQDAGCESEDVLNHCRVETVHVRGCWVVDLVLEKA